MMMGDDEDGTYLVKNVLIYRYLSKKVRWSQKKRNGKSILKLINFRWDLKSFGRLEACTGVPTPFYAPIYVLQRCDVYLPTYMSFASNSAHSSTVTSNGVLACDRPFYWYTSKPTNVIVAGEGEDTLDYDHSIS